MRLHLLGVRGSTAAPGPDFVRYGGHTSCVAVQSDVDDEPHLLLDAGTGVRGLPRLLGRRPFTGAVLVTHLHWDHVQGLPFCPAVDHDGAVVTLWLPAQHGRSARDLLAQSMSPPAFPIEPEGLRGRWTFSALESGPLRLGAARVTAVDVAHKGGRTYGFRVELDGRSAAYVPDHAPASGLTSAALHALADVDVLLHDAQFLASERATADAYGHATVDDAVALAERVSARRLVLLHHSPARTDDQLDAIAREVRAGCPVTVAREGSTVELPGSSRYG